MTKRTPEEAKAYLMAQAELLGPELHMACKDVLIDEYFHAAWGSKDRHHAYKGGLVVHTAEVLEWALAMGGDPKVLIPAAIFHDYMKIRDYSLEDGSYTPYRSLIRHVAGSFAEWMKSARDWDIEESLADAIGHCILSHHGRKEWGSPVEPQTKEALILHQADMLSCHYGPGRELVLVGEELK